METIPAQHGRAEQLTAGARVVFAMLAVAAAVVDPAIALHTRAFLFCGGGYLAFAIAAAWLSRRGLVSQRTRLLTHAIDIAVATALIGLSQTPVSPLFSLYLFPLFAATLRLRARGVVQTGMAILPLYAAVALTSDVLRHEPAFFVARLTYISVATLLLAALRRHQERVHEDLLQLATWPRRAAESLESLVEDMLAFSAAVLHTPRCAALIESEDEPWVWIAQRDAGGAFSMVKEAPGSTGVRPEISNETFFCPDVADPGASTEVAAGARVKSIAGAPIDRDLRDRLAVRSVLSVVFGDETLRGRLFFLDRSDVTHDEMILADVVGRLFTTRLQELTLTEAQRSAAIGEARTGLARDLHDTLLQSFTAISLQVEAAQQHLATDPETARKRLALVQELVGQSHNELRGFISQLRPRGSGVHSLPSLEMRLGIAAAQAHRQWGLAVELRIDGDEQNVPPAAAHDIVSLVRESLANAGKHASARQVEVTVNIDPSRAEIVVADDGEGLPFHGTFSLADLERDNRGPVTLRERIAALGGQLELRTTSSGTRVAFSIPI